MRTDSNHITEMNYNTLATDFKVESVATNLLKYYKMLPNIFINRIGVKDRPYAKDLNAIYYRNYGLDEETVMMDTYRESIYDYLPEGLFHPPSLGNYGKNVESIVNEIKQQKEIEENARKFFQPFELEVFNTEVSSLLKEAEFDVNDASETVIHTLEELWPLLKNIDSHHAHLFCYILPFLHQVRGNRDWIERFLTAFLKTKVEISFLPNTIDKSDDEDDLTTLGTTRLGISFIPNGKHMDGERNWYINIGPIRYSEIEKYVSGHAFRELLQTIYDYVIPVSMKVFENFITEKTKNSFVIHTEEKTTRLGYSTFI